ncbi:MAG: DUF86 domain-containing protein [Chlamydiia bacterium]|nr:DUF86 domain-containing protein [Chlamydiia bacterium]
MPSREWKFRLEDILTSIERIENYAKDLDLETFSNHTMIVDAVIRNFEIIGEASNHIPQEIRTQFTDIPWDKMLGMRNVFIHEYFGIDTPTVWYTIAKDLPPLKKSIQNLLSKIK